jgi:hypothetical protein
MKTQTNLNFLFADMIGSFAHLLPISGQAFTKDEFLAAVKTQYCLSNPKTNLFYMAAQKSIFETIKIDRVGNCILFNQ